MLPQAEQMQKMTSISLKMVQVVILIENSCHFVSCSACNNTCKMGQLQKFNTENKSPCHDIALLVKVDFEKPRQIQNSSYDFRLKPRFSSQWSLLGGLLEDFF